MEIEVCENCESDKIQAIAWVEINSGLFCDYIDDEVFCPICDERVGTKIKNIK